MSLENKAAIVTGSDSGIGRAIALELARQGAAVTINYHKNEDAALAAKKEIEDAGGKAQIVQADVSSVADIQKLVDELREFFCLVMNQRHKLPALQAGQALRILQQLGKAQN